MLITVVTPSYNQGQYIKTTIESVLNQNYRNVEYLVMDGGSSDNTIEILKSYDDERLQWVSEPDNGQSDAINKGMRQATGDILAYLNSDDVYEPSAFSHVVEHFEQHPETDILYGHCYTIDSRGNRVEPSDYARPISTKQWMTMRLRFPQQGVFWRHKAVDEIGFFNEDLHYRMDFDYWVRMVIAGYQFAPIDKFLASFRLHDTSKTVSQADLFWKDWETIINNVYQRDDLPPEIVALEPLVRAYVHHYAAEDLLDYGEKVEARKHLKWIIQHKATFNLKALSVAMWMDSHFNTPFTQLLRILYKQVVKPKW